MTLVSIPAPHPPKLRWRGAVNKPACAISSNSLLGKAPFLSIAVAFAAQYLAISAVFTKAWAIAEFCHSGMRILEES